MLAFTCDNCGQLVFFDNTECLHCGAPLGVVPFLGVVAFRGLPGRSDRYRLFSETNSTTFRRCANAGTTRCNWMIDVVDDAALCRSCSLTRTQPPAIDDEVTESLIVAEEAKRRLIYQLDLLGLPIVGRAHDPRSGLAFDLLSSRIGPVTIGHADGVITIDLAESDDAHREGVAHALGEAYRTVLGHLRHEIGHYYWQVFASDVRRLERMREMFGDDTMDYAAALERHYRGNPSEARWEGRFVSNYAMAHPWEDWAETFAHYLHIRGTLQTAAAYGVVVAGPAVTRGTAVGGSLVSNPSDEDQVGEPFANILADWLPLTYALNELNRSIGRPPLYPFVLAPPVIDKLSLVHELVHDVSESTPVGV